MRNDRHHADNPTECSGPPHLLGPWGSAGPGAVGVASSKTPLPAGHLFARWVERGGTHRPAVTVCWVSRRAQPILQTKRAPHGRPSCFANSRNLHLILDSRNSTCFLATGSYFFLTSLSVIVREFFLVT